MARCCKTLCFCWLLLLPKPALAGSCDYASTASGPCDAAATQGSCADYYQVFAGVSYQYIQSPNYPGHYKDNQVCRWVVSACRCFNPLRPEAKFLVEVEMLDYEIQGSPSCSKDFVEVKDGNRLWAHSFGQYCGNSCVISNSDNITQSTGPHLLVTFQTDVFNANQPRKYRGFQARYRCTEYATHITDALVLGPANYLLIAASCSLLAIFSAAASVLAVREYNRNREVIK